jgi:hypothetical protein
VNDHVAQTSDRGPGNLRYRRCFDLRECTHCLADDGKVLSTAS